ncbi:MAG: hypothetical protein JWO39_2188 [Gemmatimonadetes bacterium]|nr:hypothetical protein [Gemmatimonadota bacterium]
MSRAALRFFLSCSIVCAAALCALPAAAQETTLPHLRWRTLDTRYFRFFFTADAAPWTRDVASRIDAAHDAVAALVGSAPSKRVTVIVEDPNNLSNGFALPLLDHPLIFLWPTPPDPASTLGNGSWSDQLSIHEFAHIAHLTRESRNPKIRRLTRLLPVKLGPIAVHAPRWVTEGYATFVEGRIVRGIGRPHGVARSAVLRQWAIEGQLPTYGALDGSSRFEGGDMAYLAGSAFLEWLAVRNGDSSVVHLWRRMTARVPRTFDDAFVGVFGTPPDELYGRFAAELTHDAMDASAGGPQPSVLVSAADTVPRAGEGALVQRLRWATGAPALAPGDSLLAFVVSDRERAPRVVILNLNRRTDDSAGRARARAHALDPEDVAAVPPRAPPLEIVARLWPRSGMSFAEPRFFADGERVLLTGLGARGDGVYRRDLFVWHWQSGSVQRITHGAGIRHADVSPNGSIVADRCVAGRCDLVRVEMATGAITVLAMGDATHRYDRPRFSRDGSAITFAVQFRNTWHVATMPASTGVMSVIGDPSASEYAPAFARGDSVLVLTSEAGGVANIVRLDRATGSVAALTNVSGAALYPDVSADGWVYFLRLHSRGLDIARIALDSALSPKVIAHNDSVRALYPWVASQPPGGMLDSLDVVRLPDDRAYGLGPREQRLLVSVSWASEGKSGGLAYAGTDPVGKLTWLLQGQWGDRASWRGASLGAAFRGSRPMFGVEAFALENRPSRQHSFAAPIALDARYRGVSAWTELDDDKRSHEVDVRALVSYGTVDPVFAAPARRALAELSVRGGMLQTPADWRIAERLGAALSTGDFGGESWTRIIATGSLAVNRFGHALALDAMYGRISRDIAYEKFALGGLAPPLVDTALLAQRVSMPVLPIAAVTGRAVATMRASIPGSIWRPYYWIGSASDDLGAWTQVVGIEGSWHTDGIWMVRVPGVNILGGIGYSLAGAARHHTQAYISIGYRP